MNDWNELQIDNLPPDILTGDYEFEDRVKTCDRLSILEAVLNGYNIRYRRKTINNRLRGRKWKKE